MRNFLDQLTQSSITLTGAMVMGVVSWTLVLTILITGLVLSGERPHLTQQQPGQGFPPRETEAAIPTLEPATTPVLIETVELTATLEPVPTPALIGNPHSVIP